MSYVVNRIVEGEQDNNDDNNKRKGLGKHVLFVGSRDVTRRTDGRRSSAVASRRGHDAFIGEAFAWSLLAIARCYSSVGVSHALRGKIAFVHPLGAVLAGCSAVLVHTLGLALATPNTGSSSAEGRGPHNRRHFLRRPDGPVCSKEGVCSG